MRSTIAIAALAVAACTGPDNDGTFTGPPTTTTLPGGSGSDGTTSSSSADDTSGGTTDGGSSGSSGSNDSTSTKLDVGAETDDPPPTSAEVFGHSADVLYRLDPDTNEVEIVGTFDGCTASIIDIALDANSQMYGAAFGSLWSIDRTTAECTLIAQGSYPTSLSFVPAGTVDPAVEALVGFDDSQYIRIDPQTGDITNLGTLSDGLISSGDMVSVIDGGSWLTVRGPGCDNTDCIVELDPTNGNVLVNYGPLPYDQVFGLAFWAGRAYGFARDGVLFEVEFNGGSVNTTPIPIPVAPPDLEFFGAGSTTAAPPAG